ncbi:MAG: FAD-dependent oxidoreductase [Chloroflexi bacterium]|nr:FAD-dependent oxidoreductase [Chloroflexota bacterium]
MKTFDVVVIGSGSGLEVSSEAAERGLSVAIIEPGPFGGTCLNRGCIPSKMLIHSADVAETIRRSELFGIKAEISAIDWDFIVRRASDTVDADARMIEQGNRELANVTVFTEPARFVDAKTLEVGGERVTAERIVIAAGSRPRVIEIEGLDVVPFLTSDEALRLPRQPERLTIAGGGFIAAELAHFFGALGTAVTIVHRGAGLVRFEDEQVARRFTELYQRRFRLLLNSTITRARRANGEILLDVAVDGRSETLATDALLLAVGRVPNTDTLAVAKAGVALDEHGHVITDEYLETNVAGVWALGDIVGRYYLKHSANLEAAHVAHNMLNPAEKIAIDYHAMPHAIFASPQIASVGTTEQEARRKGVAFLSAVYDYSDTAYGSSIEDHDGFVKVLVDPESGEIIGCHIIGTDASVLIQEVANLMRMRAPASTIGQAIYVHPALPEVVQRAFTALQP